MDSITRHRWLVLLAALLFSTGGAAIKATDLSIWQVASFRSGIAAILLWMLIPSWRRGLSWSACAVGVAYAATMVLFVAGNKLTTAANTIFLQSTAPLYLLALGPWLLRERTRRRDLGFAAALAVGMALFFVGAEDPSSTAPMPVRGNVLAGFAGITWALCILGLRQLGRRSPDSRIDCGGAAVLVGNALACLACLPLAFPVARISTPDVLVVVYLGAFQIGLAYVCLTRGVRRVPALEASLLLLLEPVLSGVWALAFHGERPGPWSFAGGAVILVVTLTHTLVGATARRSAG